MVLLPWTKVIKLNARTGKYPKTMKIKTKTYLLVILISLLFPGLYLFVLGLMRGLDVKMNKAMVANRMRELAVEAGRNEEDYLRTGALEKITSVNANLDELMRVVSKAGPTFKLAPQDYTNKMMKLAQEDKAAFKEVSQWKQEIAAGEEKLAAQGDALEKALSEALKELKSAKGTPVNEPLAAKVDKITLANKILKEGYGAKVLSAPSKPPGYGSIQNAILGFSRQWHRDTLVEAASAYAASFQAVAELRAKGKEPLKGLHQVAGDLEKTSSDILLEMNRKRDETQDAMMMAILGAFAICGLLVLSLSLWLFSLLTGPILRLRHAMLQIAGGNLNATIDVHSHDEIGELAESFRTMENKLRDSYKNLRLTNEKLTEQASELARSNQDLDQYSEKLKEANSRLKKLDELKSNFISAASHELKTPLTSIKGYLEMVLNGEAGLISDEQKEYLGYVKQSTDRLQRLLKELLNISKIESGRATLKRELTDLKILMKEEMVLFQAQAHEKGTVLSMEVDPALKPVHCDSDKIREVLDNLLSNAIKYTPARGKVKMFSRNHAQSVEIGVQDNGIGIKKEDQGRIFEPFQHLDSNGTELHEESTGLGLTLVKKIVEAHGGQIRVESQEGKGATFTVILPMDMKQGNLNELIGHDR